MIIIMQKAKRFMVLSDSQKFELIRLVRENECLWNPKNEFYHKSKSIQRYWEQASLSLLGSSRYSDIIKEQWHSLRTYFMSLRRKSRERNSRCGPGFEDTSEPKWQFFQDMTFLLESRAVQDKDSYFHNDSVTMSTSDDVSNVDSPTSPMENYEVFIQEKENTAEISVVDNHEAADSITKSRISSIKLEKDAEPACKYKRVNGACNTSSESLSSISEAMQNQSPLTPDDLFCIILSSHLKALPDSYDKEILKLELMQRVVSHRYQIDEHP